jgi:hypothetical protein
MICPLAVDEDGLGECIKLGTFAIPNSGSVLPQFTYF